MMVRTTIVPAILLLNLLGASCAVKPEEPGLCALKCGGAVIGTNEFIIEPVSEGIKLQCPRDLSAETDFGVVLAQFLVFEKGFDSTGAETKTPVPSISFEANVTGRMSQSDEPSNFPSDEDAALKRNRGIRTPKANWCSDTCGVITLELVPVCIHSPGTTNTVNVQVHSGPLFSKELKIEVETPADPSDAGAALVP